MDGELAISDAPSTKSTLAPRLVIPKPFAAIMDTQGSWPGAAGLIAGRKQARTASRMRAWRNW
jgi:hypothetical protein